MRRDSFEHCGRDAQQQEDNTMEDGGCQALGIGSEMERGLDWLSERRFGRGAHTPDLNHRCAKNVKFH